MDGHAVRFGVFVQRRHIAAFKFRKLVEIAHGVPDIHAIGPKHGGLAVNAGYFRQGDEGIAVQVGIPDAEPKAANVRRIVLGVSAFKILRHVFAGPFAHIIPNHPALGGGVGGAGEGQQKRQGN